MERYLQIKLEPVDSEYYPDNWAYPLRNHNNGLKRPEIDSSKDRTMSTPSSSTPVRKRPLTREEIEFVMHMKKELLNTHQIISEQSAQLERAEKKIASQEEKIRHQDELLMRTEADQKTDKAIKDAENVALRKLLEEEKRRRIFSEQRFKKLLEARKNFLAQRHRGPMNRTTVATTGGTSAPRFPIQNYGSKNAQGMEIRRYRPSETSATGSNASDDIVVLNVIQKQNMNSGSSNNNMGRPQIGGRPVAMKSNTPQNWVKNPVSKFPCTICGLSFDALGKLLSHSQWHRSQRPFVKRVPAGHIPKTTATPATGTQITRKPGRPRSTIDFVWSKPASIVSGNVGGGRSTFSTAIQTRRSQKVSSEQSLKNKFPCKVCGNRYGIISKLKLHMKQVHGIVDDKFEIGCKECGKVFSTRTQHVRHRKSAHGTVYAGKRKESDDESYTPSQTSSASGSSDNAPPSTAETEAASPPPVVAGCSKTLVLTTTSSKTPEEHGVDHEKASTGNYCLCGRRFRTAKTLDEHIRHSNEERKCICDVCGMMFREVLYLKLHMNQAHGAKEIVEIPENSEILLPFGNTGIDAAASENEEEDPLASDEESQQTGQSPVSPGHKLVGEDPEVNYAKYLCSCGRSYSCRSSFMIHSRSKNNGKILKCTLCAYSFDLHGNLKSHVRKAHKVNYGQGRYACSSCAQKFETSTLLVRHRFYLCKYRITNRKDKLKK